MKYLIFFIFLSFNVHAIAPDMTLAKTFKLWTKQFELSRKSTTPDKVAIFISYKTNPNYMDSIIETFDTTDIANNNIYINRPNSSAKKRSIDSCKHERNGVVTVGSTRILVKTNIFPIRIQCVGDNGNYRETYITYQSN